MVFSERFMDSYPYEISQMPYGRHPYHPYFGSGPQMKVEQPRGRYGYPSSRCHHGCCDDGYFAGPGARPAYPHCVQHPAPFGHHGVYPGYNGTCHVPHEMEGYEYGPRNHGCPGSSCCNHSSGCGKKNLKGGETMPGVDDSIDEVKCYPRATVPFPNGYARKMDDIPCKKRYPSQFDAGRTRLPLADEHEKFDMRNNSGPEDLQEYAEAWPWDLHGVEPRTRGMSNGIGRSKSPNASDINRTCDGKASRQPFAHPVERTSESHPSKKVRTIEVKNVSEADQNSGAVETLRSGKVLDVKLKKTYSDDEAAVLIQSVYRGYEVRRFNLLDKLKRIANIREQAVGVEGRIQSLQNSACPVDEKQRLVIEESIMSLLLKLDGVQGLPPRFREIRKSAARELTRMQERLDALIMQKPEEVNDEEMSEPLETCVETNSEELKDREDNEGTEVECGNESCEVANQEQLMYQVEHEMAKPDQATESLCVITDKEENHVGVDSEKVAMNVEHEVTPMVEFEVNMENEHEVNPTVELGVNSNCEPARGCEIERAEPARSSLSFSEKDEQPKLEVNDDAGIAHPESLTTVDSGITDDAQLKSVVIEMGTQTEGEIRVVPLSSTKAAPEILDDEGLLVALPSSEPVFTEAEDGALMGSDIVEPGTRDAGEILDDGTFSRPAHDEVTGGAIEGHEKLVNENEELKKLTEKLMEITKEQSAVISDLNKRVDNLEKRLIAKQKSTKNRRSKK